ncbi:hypothetical protein AVEN_6319-1, partial [Araneus ventricosus]
MKVPLVTDNNRPIAFRETTGICSEIRRVNSNNPGSDSVPLSRDKG